MNETRSTFLYLAKVTLATIRRWPRVSAVIAVLSSAGLTLLLWPWPGVNSANFARIELGMTQPQVERILGRAPNYMIREYGKIHSQQVYTHLQPKESLNGRSGFLPYQRLIWSSRPEFGMDITVILDESGRVVHRLETLYMKRSFFDDLLRLIWSL
jgi:hypothetical protein